jgi:outer membrane lipoprotein-sorting protein
VIELAPRREDIGYKQIVMWLGRDDLFPRRLEFYEDGDQPKKRLTQGQVSDVGAIPVAHAVEVVTPSVGTKTVMDVVEVRFNQGLDDDLFTQRQLERGSR